MIRPSWETQNSMSPSRRGTRPSWETGTDTYKPQEIQPTQAPPSDVSPWLQKHPTLNKYIFEPIRNLTQAYEETGPGKFNVRASQSALGAISGAQQESVSTGNKVADTAADLLGFTGGTMMLGGSALPFARTAGQRALISGGENAALSATQGIARGDSPEQIAKDTALNTAFGAAFGVAPDVIKGAKSAVTNASDMAMAKKLGMPIEMYQANKGKIVNPEIPSRTQKPSWESSIKTNATNIAPSKEITIPFRKNTQPAPTMLDDSFAQSIEPKGDYINFHDPGWGTNLPNTEYGNIAFKNPLIIEYETSGHGGWKTKLSQRYGGKTGNELSEAIKKEGYDGVITVDSKNKEVSEIVNLGGLKSNMGNPVKAHTESDILNQAPQGAFLMGENKPSWEQTKPTPGSRENMLRQEKGKIIAESSDASATMPARKYSTPEEYNNWRLAGGDNEGGGFRNTNDEEIATTTYDLISNSDKWKDKRPLSLKNETWDRNIIDIAGQEDGEKIRNYIFRPIHENEAARNRFLNEQRDKIKALNLTKKERELTQMYGEGKITRANLPPESVQKVENAVSAFRQFYADALVQANKVLLRNGYEAIQARRDYFPHFEGEDPIMKALGINIDVTDLPTDINGLTHGFKPGKNWFGNFLRREGDKTTYDAVEGFDRYVEGISRVIYHTDDIQKLRSLNLEIRTKYSPESIGAEISQIKSMDLPKETKKELIEKKLKEAGQTHLSNAVADLEEYTNVLAGKKDLADRSFESMLGRGMYNISSFLVNRIGRNMVAVNPGSWITQFIPITQVAAVSSKKNVIKALGETMRNLVNNDGFHNKSTFMSNRIGSDSIVKGAADRIGDVLSAPMYWVDRFSANMVTRSKYLDGLDKGMTPKEAMRYADDWAAKIIGDRSLGAQPTLYNQRNPLTRVLTQFQLEVNNQLKVIYKDIPREYRKDPRAKMLIGSAIGQLALYGFLYNQAYEALTGRRPALDPIGIAFDFKEDITNLKPSDALANLGENVVNTLPYAGTFTGGRIPIGSALPNLTNIGRAFAGSADDGVSSGETAKKIGKELIWPAINIALPVGAGQIKKTIQGLSAVNQGGEYGTTTSGEKYLKYPIEQSTSNKVRAAVFGKSSLPETREYYDNNRRALSVNQTKQVQSSQNPKATYEGIMKYRAIDTINNKIKDIQKDNKLTAVEKQREINKLVEKRNQLIRQ